MSHTGNGGASSISCRKLAGGVIMMIRDNVGVRPVFDMRGNGSTEMQCLGIVSAAMVTLMIIISFVV